MMSFDFSDINDQVFGEEEIVGEGVGLVDGETDGPLLGLFEGDWLGFVVGCEMNDEKRRVSDVC